MQDLKSYYDLKEKSLEIILNFKPSTDQYDLASEELLKLQGDIKKAISFLPNDTKNILELRFYKNLSVDEISQKIGKDKEETLKLILRAIDEVKIVIKRNFPQSKAYKEQDKISKELPLSQKKQSHPKRENPVATLFLLAVIFISVFFGINKLLRFLPNESFRIAKNITSSKPLAAKIKSNRMSLRTVKISGSSSLQVLAGYWQRNFKSEFPKYDVKVLSSDSNEGITSLIEGEIDIAASSRPVTYTDEKFAAENGLELNEQKVALDALVIIVNSKNPISELSLESLESVFNGESDNWLSLNNQNQMILPLAREKGSGTNDFVINRILENNNFASSVLRKNSNKEIIDYISAHPEAIGFINSNAYSWDNKNIKYLKVKNYEDSTSYSPFEDKKLNEHAIRYGDYPLSRYLYLVTTSSHGKSVDDFIKWILSSEGQSIVERSGLIPVKA